MKKTKMQQLISDSLDRLDSYGEREYAKRDKEIEYLMKLLEANDLIEKDKNEKKQIRGDILTKTLQVAAIAGVTLSCVYADNIGKFASKIGLSVTPKMKLF